MHLRHRETHIFSIIWKTINGYSRVLNELPRLITNISFLMTVESSEQLNYSISSDANHYYLKNIMPNVYKKNSFIMYFKMHNVMFYVNLSLFL